MECGAVSDLTGAVVPVAVSALFALPTSTCHFTARRCCRHTKKALAPPARINQTKVAFHIECVSPTAMPTTAISRTDHKKKRRTVQVAQPDF